MLGRLLFFNLLCVFVLAGSTAKAVFQCDTLLREDRKALTAFETFANDLGPIKRNSLEFALKLTSVRHLIKAYDAILANQVQGKNIFDKFLKALNIRTKYDQRLLDMIPATGPVVITSNHPFGGMDGVTLMALIKQKRPDVKFFASTLMLRVPELSDHVIPVSFEPTPEGKKQREEALKQAQEFVNKGGALVLFPAGSVSEAPIWNLRKPVDGHWRNGAANILMSSGATSVSVRFTGRNSLWFHLMGKIPGLRPVFLGGEITNKRGRILEVVIAEPVKRDWNKEFKTPDELTGFLRTRTDQLRAGPPGVGEDEPQSYDP